VQHPLGLHQSAPAPRQLGLMTRKPTMKKNQAKPNRVGATAANAPTKAATEGKQSVLQVSTRAGVTEERQFADVAIEGIATNALTARSFLAGTLPSLSITEMVASLKDHGRRVNANDLTAAEQMLCAQAVALNAIFGEMARRSAMNMGEYIDATDRYMRLALKAQGQSRATVETLAAMKNPPVFAKQANIANGPQQVNNGGIGTSTHGRAHAGETANQQSKLLEDVTDGSTYVEPRAAPAAARGHSKVEAVAEGDRATKRGGQG